MIKFQWIYLAILLLAPVVLYYVNKKHNGADTETQNSLKSAVKLPFYQDLMRSINYKESNLSYKSIRFEQILIILIWTFLILAAMRPTWYGTPQHIDQKGRDIMLAVDISGSWDEGFNFGATVDSRFVGISGSTYSGYVGTDTSGSSFATHKTSSPRSEIIIKTTNLNPYNCLTYQRLFHCIMIATKGFNNIK